MVLEKGRFRIRVPVSAATGNALFAVTGTRFYDLPLTPDVVAKNPPYLDRVRNPDNGYVSFNFLVRESDSMEISCRAVT